MLNASQLLDKLGTVLPGDAEFLMYGDAGYTSREDLLISPFKRFSELKRCACILVEHRFGAF